MVREIRSMTSETEVAADSAVAFHGKEVKEPTNKENTSPESTGKVTPPSDTEPKITDKKKDVPNFISSNRGRVLSLDRGQAEIMARRLAEQDDVDDDDDDDNSTVTSDGESSYFAKHLPSPKSGTRFLSDTASTSSAPVSLRRTSSKIESDASLSFSDDDEDEMQMSDSSNVGLPPPVPRGAIEGMENVQLAKQTITRMHSASSLVSTASSDQKLSSVNEGSSSSSGSESGAIHREHTYPQSSPNIGYDVHVRGPPQPLNPDQLNAWVAAGNVPHHMDFAPMMNPPMGYPRPPQFVGYPVPPVVPPRTSPTGQGGSNASLTLIYSEESDADDANALEQQLAGGDASHGAPQGGTIPPGGPHNPGVSNGHGQDRGVGEESPLLSEAAPSGQVAFRSAADAGSKDPRSSPDSVPGKRTAFKVYWMRWLMLMYMSLLNLLSDWTCYSVAPIAVLTSEAFGSIDPEQLVVVFLGANAVATACEPIILSRLGLRRTVIFGSFLLMLGSMVKSGGYPPIIESNLTKGEGEWRVYVGFFLVGLSQPLYQCTPALLSASWFPEKERTMATGVALNANQLGIGFAFIFGTLLVATSDDIVPYFGLLSIISTLTFIGTLFHFDDAPPTPPSDTARVIRGSFAWRMPDADQIWTSIRNFGNGSSRAEDEARQEAARTRSSGRQEAARTRSSGNGSSRRRSKKERGTGAGRSRRSSSSRKSGDGPGRKPSSTTRRRAGSGRSQSARADRPAAPAPSPGSSRRSVNVEIARMEKEARQAGVILPSAMISGPVSNLPPSANNGDESISQQDEAEQIEGQRPMDHVGQAGTYQQGPPGMQVPPYPVLHPYYGGVTPHQPYFDHHYPPQVPYQQGPMYYPEGVPYQQPSYLYQPNPYYPQYPYGGMYDLHNFDDAFADGAEPTLTVTDHHLDINIRDDQIILSTRACFSRPGFIHALVAFTASGIVINTLSTFMDYLVRLNGAGREYVGIVGGSFQFCIMISSLIIGKQTDKTRAYYSVTIGMLVLGAFGLAECGVSLDADRGSDLRWSLILVAILVGPLQPVSTELGVEVAYPLSENTVLVIQQLFSNLLSALFIPFFKALRDVGTERIDATEMYERPQYTFSFYLLIVIHATVTVFFATFNGRYLRYEHENEKKRKQDLEEQAEMAAKFEQQAQDASYDPRPMYPNEQQPLMSQVV